MYIYNQKGIRKTDDQAVKQGFSMYALMENAGRAIYEKVESILSKQDHILILAGRGNNGGDGIVLARYLKENNYHMSLSFPLGLPQTEVAKQHLQFYKNQGFTIEPFEKDRNYDVIIDSLLGVGTNLPLSFELTELINWCNQKDCLKIAIDMPTGTRSDHGNTNQAFQANYTFCLHGFKPSAFLLPASEYFGEIYSCPIGLKHKSRTRVLNKVDVTRTFPKRSKAAHKGSFGTSLLIAGSDNMPGSALLGAIGAMRTGTGKLIIATSKLATNIIATRVPEETFLLNGLEQIIDNDLPEKVSAIGIGPGIDDNEKVTLALKKLIKLNVPLVIDAGALIPFKNLGNIKRSAPIILTPHPGEFSRLTNYSIEEIQANRIELAKTYATENHVTIVLKGQNTVIAYPDGEVLINRTGNNALAKGGSGDVLTGMIISMLSTHKYFKHAVANAVYIHGLCANKWVENNSYSSMVASDFDQLLPIILKEFEQ